MKGTSIHESINRIRQNPTFALSEIKAQLNRFQSNTVYRNNKGDKVRCQSGKSAWQESVLILDRQKSKNQLLYSGQLELASNQCLLAVQANSQHTNPNLYQVIASIFSYSGSISFLRHQSELQNTPDEVVTEIVIGDQDQKKNGRVSIFHPLYKMFGCAVHQTSSKIVMFMIFAESIAQPVLNNKNNKQQQYSQKQSDKKRSSQSSFTSFSPHMQLQNNNNKNHSQKPQQNPQTKQSSLARGSEVITQLNCIRKDPKNYIHSLKSQLDKFKNQTTLITQYSTLTLKQGKIAYYDLISELQAQYSLPSIKQVHGLALTAYDQTVEIDKIAIKENRTKFQILLGRHCSESESVRSFKIVDIGGWPIPAIVMALLVGDGDKKRTARKKLMSPVYKAIGCCVQNSVVVVNIGESAKDSANNSKDVLQIEFSSKQEHLHSFSPKKWKQKGHQQKQQIFPSNLLHINKGKGMNINKANKQQRIVLKKTSKSTYKIINGLEYKITQIKILYDTEQIEEFLQEELMK